MPLDIKQYALIGNTRTAALVGSDGPIDTGCAFRASMPVLASRRCWAHRTTVSGCLHLPAGSALFVAPTGNTH